MGDRSFSMGPIRPPSEAGSLLLQVTEGCTWNKCKFCVVYRGSAFHIKQPEEIKNNIDNMAYFRDMIIKHSHSGSLDKQGLYSELELLDVEELQCFYMVYNWLAGGGRSVFLQDGNSIALKPEKLADVLFYLREKFPHIERITTYGRAESLSRWSVEQLKLLRESGLNRIHTGFESGSDNVLKLINKGLTQQQEIDGGIKAKEAGFELSVYFMPGIGGKEYSEENSSETAKVINAINPDFVRIRTFVLKKDSEMYPMELNGEFTSCTDREKLIEIRNLISKIDAPDVNIVSDHIVNLIGSLSGRIGSDKAKMLSMADQVTELSERDFKIYQLARRYGYIENLSQLPLIPEAKLSHFHHIVTGYEDEAMWEEHITDVLRQYV